VIRRATDKDHPWIVDLAALVYRALGDYRAIIPGWLEHPGVMPYVAERDGCRTGFILLGFYVPADAPRGAFVADLLAIAVEPELQRKGIGRKLLDYAIEVAEAAARSNHVPEMRLTVAETNGRAQNLFRSAGFLILDREHGTYDGGQRAIRMQRPVSAVPAVGKIRRQA